MRKSILFVTNRRPESQTQTLTNFLYPWKSSLYNVRFWWVVTVTVVTVIFSRVSNFLFLYITIYILISYIVYIRDIDPHFLIVGTVYCRICRSRLAYSSSKRLTTRRSSSAASRQKSLKVPNFSMKWAFFELLMGNPTNICKVKSKRYTCYLFTTHVKLPSDTRVVCDLSTLSLPSLHVKLSSYIREFLHSE